MSHSRFGDHRISVQYLSIPVFVIMAVQNDPLGSWLARHDWYGLVTIKYLAPRVECPNPNSPLRDLQR